MAKEIADPAKTEIYLEQLEKALTSSTSTEADQRALLNSIRIASRSKANAEPLSTPAAIKTLTSYAFSPALPHDLTLAVLRPLANILFLYPQTQQLLVDLQHGVTLATRLAGCVGKPVKDTAEDQFLLCRLLFLLTYQSRLKFAELVDQQRLAKSVNELLAGHARTFPRSSTTVKTASRPSSSDGPQRGAMEDMALNELLKLLFNITHYTPDRVSAFSPSIPNILKVLVRMRNLPAPRTPTDPNASKPLPLTPPTSYLLNALMSLDLEDTSKHFWGFSPLFPVFDQKLNAEVLISILDAATNAYPESELDSTLIPLLTVLRRIHNMAPDPIKKLFRASLLPSEEDRQHVLGQSDSLASRLLRISTSALAPQTRGAVGGLLFELSGEDEGEFVGNVGYGFASGFLMNRKMSIPQSREGAWATRSGGQESIRVEEREDGEPPGYEERRVVEVVGKSGDGEEKPPEYSTAAPTKAPEETGSKSPPPVYRPERASAPQPASARAAAGLPVSARTDTDAVTGQLLSAKAEVERLTGQAPEMTDEEKEREAERLFVLFERLRKNGVISVENPVATALREGRLEG